MRKLIIAISCSLIVLLAACKKEPGRAVLPNGSISFQYAADKDTVQIPLSVLNNTTLVFPINAALTGNTSSTGHYVSFAIDTTAMIAYRSKYGAAAVLPVGSYFFFKPTTRLAAGASLSDPAQLNITQETKLNGYSTYVLPVIIQSVDGIADGAATNRVVYFVFKTGKPAFIGKTGWTIADFSSGAAPNGPAAVLDDDNVTTYWATSLTGQMPQYVTINFNQQITFSAVNYYLPSAIAYPAYGGYPTSIKIETSMDGVTWVDNGTYNGNIANNMQTLNTGITTARYLRFTSLASVKFAGFYSVIFISGISLVP